eukprot:GHVL01020308.1.p1 GENE.GHVL01020308.1~~GHVL01020308.1.p1  ORF type:complete len:701 (-),score=116.68 GHVL01020308.1:253-2355(-)
MWILLIVSFVFVIFSCSKALEFEPILSAPDGAESEDIGLPTSGRSFARSVPSEALDGADKVTLYLPGLGKIDAFSDPPDVQNLGSSDGVETIPGMVSWTGLDENHSHVVLTSFNGTTVGTISGVNGTFAIRPSNVAGDSIVIAQVNVDKIPPEGHMNDIPEQDEADMALSSYYTTYKPDAMQGAGAVVDVLVVYTQKAAQLSGSEAALQLTIINAQDWTNTAYKNSNIPHRMNVIAIQKINYVESTDMNSDLTYLRSDSTVNNLREQYGADLVAIIRDNSAGFCGLGFVLTQNSGRPDLAVSTSALQCLPSTFAHETAHNMGSAHDRDSATYSPSFRSYSFGYRHCVSSGWRTVMAYSCAGASQRVPYFSNPNIAYLGKETGSYEADNARSLRESMQLVAQYRRRLMNQFEHTETPAVTTAPPPPPPTDCHSGLSYGASNYCSANCKCDKGEGGCTSDSGCTDGLYCIYQNGVNTCEDLTDIFNPNVSNCDNRNLPIYHSDYCTIECPCEPGEGDCDTNEQCKGSSVCLQRLGVDLCISWNSFSFNDASSVEDDSTDGILYINPDEVVQDVENAAAAVTIEAGLNIKQKMLEKAMKDKIPDEANTEMNSRVHVNMGGKAETLNEKDVPKVTKNTIESVPEIVKDTIEAVNMGGDVEDVPKIIIDTIESVEIIKDAVEAVPEVIRNMVDEKGNKSDFLSRS